MAKQSLTQRVERIVNDAIADTATDIRARWQKVVDDGIAAEATTTLGPMPDATLDDVDLADAIQYAGADADATWQLNPILDQQIEALGLRRALEIDYAILPMVRRMMDNGMLIDPAHFATLGPAFDEAMDGLAQEIRHYSDSPDFNPGSGDQIAWLLYEHLGLGGRRKTKSGKRLSTDDKALEALKYAHPVVSLIQEYREIGKLRGTYCCLPEFADAHGRIHPDLSMVRVPSGRFASGDDRLLTIPTRTNLGKEIRRGFIAPPGKVLASADLSQIEMRVMAHLSGDANMLEAFWDGVDIHTRTAQLMYDVKEPTQEQRHHGKQVGFGIVNLITAMGLTDQMYLRGAWRYDDREYQSHLAQAQLMIDLYLDKAYPGIRTFQQRVWDEGRRNGYVRCGLSGRIWRLPGLRSSIDKVKSEAERQATNFMIQAGAQTAMKLGMAKVWDWLGGWSEDLIEPLLQVHDELVLEVADSANGDVDEDLLRLLTSGIELDVPVTANWHTGLTWADLK